ncbi:MAG: lipopolysaccharide heptosyltransferase II [Phycisphaerae bacterium]|nr:lipopolysaccharide heptosyltransferase II [Phycisphaerae bacterium]
MAQHNGTDILVLLPTWIGDAVMATPTLRALRAARPNARITHMGSSATLDVLAPDPWADDVLTDTSRQRPRLANFHRIAARLRRRRYATGLLLPNSFRTAALVRAGGVTRVVGYDRDVRGWMLTRKLAPPRDADGELAPVPAIDYYLDLARLVGVGCDGRVPSRRMELTVSPEQAADADAVLDEAGIDPGRPLVMLNPGAAFGPAKMWSPHRYAALADRLAARGAQIIVNAAPSERTVAGHVVAEMGTRPLLDFSRRDNTLGRLKGLLRRCDLLVTNDTGARHVAAALGVGVVTLFGATDPRWTRIDCPRERILCVDVACGPCQRKICPLPAGPAYHQCMSHITVEMVLDACGELLEQRSPTAGSERP